MDSGFWGVVLHIKVYEREFTWNLYVFRLVSRPEFYV